jgi:WD40 repeat protein
LVWEAETGETVRFLAGHTDWVTAIAVTRNALRAVSASADGTLRIWDLESGQSLGTLAGHTDLVNALALTPDGRYVISASADHTLRVWDVDSGDCITTFTGEGPMMRCVVAPDGRAIIAREKSGRGHFLRMEGFD